MVNCGLPPKKQQNMKQIHVCTNDGDRVLGFKPMTLGMWPCIVLNTYGHKALLPVPLPTRPASQGHVLVAAVVPYTPCILQNIMVMH